MRLMLHNFRKDARRLWPAVLVTLVMLATLARADRWRGDSNALAPGRLDDHAAHYGLGLPRRPRRARRAARGRPQLLDHAPASLDLAAWRQTPFCRAGHPPAVIPRRRVHSRCAWFLARRVSARSALEAASLFCRDHTAVPGCRVPVSKLHPLCDRRLHHCHRHPHSERRTAGLPRVHPSPLRIAPRPGAHFAGFRRAGRDLDAVRAPPHDPRERYRHRRRAGRGIGRHVASRPRRVCRGRRPADAASRPAQRAFGSRRDARGRRQPDRRPAPHLHRPRSALRPLPYTDRRSRDCHARRYAHRVPALLTESAISEDRPLGLPVPAAGSSRAGCLCDSLPPPGSA